MLSLFAGQDVRSYLAAEKAGRLRLPRLCPACGGQLWGHGCYERGANETGPQGYRRIPVHRGRCRQCGRTVSFLPSFLRPEGVPEAVVVGADEHVCYPRIRQASCFILAGARFVATNADASFPTPDGPAPGTGAIVRAVEAATGRRPQIVGKPYPLMFRLALSTLPPNTRAVMVGDNPETDILGAHRAGLPGILVVRGVTPGSPAQAAVFPPGALVPAARGPLSSAVEAEDGASPAAPTPRDFRTPDAVIGSLLDLFRTGVPLRGWVPPPYPWPERVSPGVAAVVVDSERRVLWVRRNDNGLWSLPSGRVEPGETVQEAVRREVL